MLDVVFQMLLSGMVIGSAYALVGLGLTLIYGATRILNLAQGEFLMLGSFLGYWLFAFFGIPPILSLILAVVVGSLVGLGLYLGLFHQRLRVLAQEEMESFSLIVTFGVMLFITSGVSWIWTPNVYVYAWMMIPIDFFGISIMASKLLLMFVSLSVCTTIYLIFSRTHLGKGIRYTIENREAATLVGVNIDGVFRDVMIMGLSLSVIAGVLLGFNFPFNSFIGIPYTVLAFVVMILGGVGSVRGSIIGGLLLGIVESTLVYALAPALKIAISYSILIAILLLKPRGLFR